MPSRFPLEVNPARNDWNLFLSFPQSSGSGILRGTGKQKLGAIFNAIGYYVVGLPIVVVLLFVARIGLIGTGNAGGVFTQGTLQGNRL